MAGSTGNANPLPLPGGSNMLGNLPALFTVTGNVQGDMALDIGTVTKGGPALNVPYLTKDALNAMAAGTIMVVPFGTTTPAVLTAPIPVGGQVTSPGAYVTKLDFLNLQAFVFANVTIGSRQ